MSVMDSYHITCFRFLSQETRDQVQVSVKVLDDDMQPVKNINDYMAVGHDEDGFHFLVLRDKTMLEDSVYTYLSDGAILKNNVDPASYKDIFNRPIPMQHR